MKEKKQNYTSAPLPFMGQKRRFIKDFKKALASYPEDAVYVDLFGGSGLLSHTVKAQYPKAEVIYNDFDGYTKRIEAIPQTNRLLDDLREILKGYPKDAKIVGAERQRVLERVENEKSEVDYLTISVSLLFSMKYALSLDELKAATLYNKIRTGSYSAVGYLDGVNVTGVNYNVLFEKYRKEPNVVFLVDPPYLSTECGNYKNYWKLKDYLDVLNVLDNTSYFYFTSNKSTILELYEWIESKTDIENPFRSASRTEIHNHMNFQSSYTDIMIHKQFTTTTT